MTPSPDTPIGTPVDTLTLKAAAAHVGVSVSTVRRRKDALIAAGASVNPAGWVIPISALKTVFGASSEAAHDTPSGSPADTSDDSPLIEQLRAENARLVQQNERQADLIEQQARTIERQAEAQAVISAQLTKLGQLEADTVTQDPVNGEQPTPRRRWWKLWH